MSPPHARRPRAATPRASRAAPLAAWSIEAIIDQAPFSIQRFDDDGNCVQVNPACAVLWGVPREQAIGWNVRATRIADKLGHRAAVERAFAGEVVHLPDFEWVPARIGLPGAMRALDLWLCPLRGVDGQVHEVVFVSFDLTERQRMVRDLARSQQQLERLVHDVEGIVWEADARTFAFTFVSAQSEALLGYPPEAWLNATFWPEHVHPDDRAGTLGACRAATADGRNHTLEYRMLASDGREVWVRDLVNVVVEAGVPVRLRGIIIDITAQKLAAAEEERARHAVEQLNRALEVRVQERTADLESAVRELEAFSYSVSHDLRAPLRTIEGFSRILREEHAGELSPAANRHLDRVRAAASRMSALIDELLELSRVARAEVRRRKVDLSRLARAVVLDLRRGEPQRAVEVAIGDGLTAHADPTLVRAVLENLLGNAWKYTARTPAARIEVGLAATAPVPVYVVRDNGAGFDMTHAEKLFVPFQRLHRADEFEGTGVGLATVQRIVRRHGGEVWAEAAPGRGAAFFFTLERAVPRDTRAAAG